MKWQLLNGGYPEQLGLIPRFVWPNDPRPVAQQFDEHYEHGGGWMPLSGWDMDEMANISYPGDEPLQPLAHYHHDATHEDVFVYEAAWVAIVQPSGAFEVSRMD